MIRTYSRKPPACQYIEGVLTLCRLCLGQAKEPVAIFKDPADICSTLAMRIMICVGLEVKQEESLPNQVCAACYRELEQHYTFRKKCEVSYQKLKSHLQASKSREAMEATSSGTDVIKNIINEDENMIVSDLELIMESEETYSKVLEMEAEPEENIIQETSPVKLEQNEVVEEIRHTIEPEELSTLISSVLVKLGILSQHNGQFSVINEDMTRIQMETGDGCVFRMELVEEDEHPPESQHSQRSDVTAPEPPALAPAPSAAPKVTLGEPTTKKEKGRAWRCGACARRLGSRSALRRHARVHSGERPFACPRCARAFAQKEVMRRHMLVHADERPHKCSICPKSFTQRNALQLHQRSHLPPHERALALHSCPHCPKLFLYSSGLSRHLLAHAGRVFECGACARQFADRSSVLRHVRRARHAPPPQSPPQPPPSMHTQPKTEGDLGKSVVICKTHTFSR